MVQTDSYERTWIDFRQVTLRVMELRKVNGDPFGISSVSDPTIIAGTFLYTGDSQRNGRGGIGNPRPSSITAGSIVPITTRRGGEITLRDGFIERPEVRNEEHLPIMVPQPLVGDVVCLSIMKL